MTDPAPLTDLLSISETLATELRKDAAILRQYGKSDRAPSVASYLDQLSNVLDHLRTRLAAAEAALAASEAARAEAERDALKDAANLSGASAHLKHYRGIVMELKREEEQWGDPVRTVDGCWVTSTTAYNPAGDGDREVVFVEDEGVVFAREQQLDDLGQRHWVTLEHPPVAGIARILVWLASAASRSPAQTE